MWRTKPCEQAFVKEDDRRAVFAAESITTERFELPIPNQAASSPNMYRNYLMQHVAQVRGGLRMWHALAPIRNADTPDVGAGVASKPG